MSVFALERSHTAPTDVHDHTINLIDTTKAPPEVDSSANLSGSDQATTSGKTIGRHSTKGHLRKELAQRKYAKWQEAKEAQASAGETSGENSGPDSKSERPSKSDSRRLGRLRDRSPLRRKQKTAKKHDEHDTLIDVLYENQRGWFFCGIPLYSSNSLLNFDPAGWQNSMFQDSPVDITNAQLPDPTWHWEWRTWYVDMSDDVDEEGWQYSFSFGDQWAWHGSHPWFHSYVRRRRWLRKRVKNHVHYARGDKDPMKEAHMFTADYFTIHAATRDRSRDSSAERTTNNRSSFAGAYYAASDSEDDEIRDVAALMAALKRALVDREKIVAIKNFFAQGGDELFYLADAMPDIMDDFVHQTSKRQLQQALFQALDEAIKARAVDIFDDDAKRDANNRRIDNVLKAVHAAGVHTKDIEHWNYLRARAKGSEADTADETHTLDAGEDAESPTATQSAPSPDDVDPSVEEEIKGISEVAQISEEPRIGFNASKEDEESGTTKRLDKGKGKA